MTLTELQAAIEAELKKNLSVEPEGEPEKELEVEEVTEEVTEETVEETSEETTEEENEEVAEESAEESTEETAEESESGLAELTASINALVEQNKQLIAQNQALTEKLNAKEQEEAAFCEKFKNLHVSLAKERKEPEVKAPVFTDGIGD